MMMIIPLDESDIWVTANFKETQLRNIKAGQAVEISVDATGKNYNGHVDSLAGASGERFSLLAARKRHRQLRESGAAHPGQDRARSRRE